MGEAGIIERTVPVGRVDRTAQSRSDSNSNVEQQAFVETNTATWSAGDYTRLRAEFEGLFNTPRGTDRSARYEALADLIEAYEEMHYPIA